MSNMSPESKKIVPHTEKRGEPFPMSDMQQAYWIGRDASVSGGGTAMQGYLEILCPCLDVPRFERALERLLARHDMLRAVVTEDGLQKVLSLPLRWPVKIENLSSLSSSEQAARLDSIAREMGETVSDLAVWPQSEIRYSLLNAAGRGHLHMRFDQWAIDGRSFQIVLLELFKIYENPNVELPETDITFQDYIYALEDHRSTPGYAKSMEFWTARLRDLPPAPVLPAPEERRVASTGQTVSRSVGRLSREDTLALQSRCGLYGLSLSSLIAAVYGETLALWSGSENFTLNVPHFNRNFAWHPDINQLVGEFASFVLIEYDNHGTNIVAKALDWQAQLWSSMEHGDVSGMRLLRELSKARGAADFEAMPVVFTMMPARKSGDNEWEELLKQFGELVRVHGSTPQVKQDCIVSVYDGELLVYWDSRLEAFPEGMSESMFEAFLEALRELALRKDVWAAKSVVKIPARQSAIREVLYQEEVLPEHTVLDLFLDRVRQSGKNTAVIDVDDVKTYAELGAAAARLAEAIPVCNSAPEGGMPGSVALLMKKSWKAVATALAAMASGRPYMPLDPGNSPERLELMLAAGGAEIVVADPEYLYLLPAEKYVVIDIESHNLTMSPERDLASYPGSSLNSSAYVMLTSGTTGPPKAVWVGHRGLLNTTLYSNAKFNVGETDRFFVATALHHDLSVYDLFGALTTGAALVLPKGGTPDALAWMEQVQKHTVTIWNSVPAFQRLLMEEARTCGVTLPIRLHVLGGDWVPLDAKKLTESVCPGSRVYTIGGPTETTIWNIMYEFTSVPPGWKTVPYGKPIPNNRYYLFNEKMEETPDWVIGEMYCSGVGVCLAVSSSDEKTSFVKHPVTGERLYRTGDVGRYRAEGLIEIQGRKDFQINIGGYRFNPAEVEKELAKTPEVERAILVSVSGPAGGIVLGAYIVPAREGDVDLERLTVSLHEYFPFQMVPHLWRIGADLPLTANGKVDRKALAALVAENSRSIGEASGAAKADENPATELDHFVVGLWGEVLETEVPGMNANFFHLGGDSLKALRILTRISARLHVKSGLPEFFARPTPAGQVMTILGAVAEAQRMHKRPKPVGLGDK